MSMTEIAALAESIERQRAALRASFPAALRAVREGRGWTQVRLSEYLNCNTSLISLMESGHSPPSPETIRRLAELESRPR